MSRFGEEVRLIPSAAWAIATLICVAVAAAGSYLLFGRQDSFMLLVFIPMAVIFAIYVLLIGYVYVDARRRGMRYVVWTLLAIFVPNAVGIILYFLLREPIQRPCPNCGTGSKPGLAYCPNCGAAVARSCPQCKSPVEASWRNCAHCGVVI